LQSKHYAKSIANAFVFDTFFGGEPREWAETPGRHFPIVAEFLLDKLLPSAK
jgi:hypothetical protein